MENLNVTRDAGEQHLGLNIVCQDDVKPLVKRKRAKKFNKYEKRRAKARQARQQDEQVESKNDFLVESKDQVTLQEKKHIVETNVENETLVMEDTFQDEQQESPVFEATSCISKPQSRQPKSRKVHSTDTLENEEERARYMREFHARPMEMDRRSGATAQIAPSRESSHLFDQNNLDGFSSLHPRLLSSLVKLNITRPTIIQTRAIQSLQTNRHSNLFIQSETGSGKTLAFLLPILQVRYVLFHQYEYYTASGMDRLSDGLLCLRRDSNLLDCNNNNNNHTSLDETIVLHSSVCMYATYIMFTFSHDSLVSPPPLSLSFFS
jgi:hypothetical protein